MDLSAAAAAAAGYSWRFGICVAYDIHTPYPPPQLAVHVEHACLVGFRRSVTLCMRFMTRFDPMIIVILCVHICMCKMQSRAKHGKIKVKKKAQLSAAGASVEGMVYFGSFTVCKSLR
jgi:hypothetical protein